MTNNGETDNLPDHTEVYDEAEQAAFIQLNDVAQSMAEIRAKTAPETHPDFDGKHCIDCLGDIPKERLKMGRIRCVYCQAELEHHNKQHAKRKD